MKPSQKITLGFLYNLAFFYVSKAFAQTSGGATPLPSHDQINIVSAAFQQIANNPASLAVVGSLCVVAWLADDLPFINSKYVAHLTVIAGASVYWMFAGPDSVPKSFPYPSAVLVNNGIMCGFFAFIIHRQFVARAINWARFRNGDSAQQPSSLRNPNPPANPAQPESKTP